MHFRHLTGKRMEDMLRGQEGSLEVLQSLKHKVGSGLR